MALMFAVLGFILLVANAIILYRIRREVNALIRTPFERTPAVMFSFSEYRVLRLYRQSNPDSWLWHAYYVTGIGSGLCFLVALKSLK